MSENPVPGSDATNESPSEDWGDLAGLEPIDAEVSESESATETTEVETVEDEAPLEAAQPETEEAEEVSPQEETAAVSEEVEPESVEPPTPEVDVQKLREDYITQLATGTYQMTEEDGEEILASPHETLPKLVAQAHVAIMDSMQGMLARYMQTELPTMIEQVSNVSSAKAEANKAFFDTWSELKDFDPQTLQGIAQNFWKSNPKSSIEDMVKAVGTQAWIMSGRDPTAALQRIGKKATKPSKPKPPPSPGNPGGSSISAPPRVEEPVNEFAEMVDFTEGND